MESPVNGGALLNLSRGTATLGPARDFHCSTLVGASTLQAVVKGLLSRPDGSLEDQADKTNGDDRQDDFQVSICSHWNLIPGTVE